MSAPERYSEFSSSLRQAIIDQDVDWDCEALHFKNLRYENN